MRILHISDIHIGVETYGRPATKTDIDNLPTHFAPDQNRSQYIGANTRLLDFLAAFDQAIHHALNNNIHAILFSGDAYKLRDPSQTHQREFARRIARLANAGIPTLLVIGNHDLPNIANRATALEIFPTLNVNNITVCQTIQTHTLQTTAGNLQIVALPWIRISQFLARDETRNMTLEQIKQTIESRLAQHLQDEIDNLDPQTPAILCAHLTATGAVAASEQSMMLGNDHVLGLGTLARPEFDYVALGHMHRHQTLSRNPPVVYAGSIERVDFGEENDQKGFIIIDIDPAKPRGQRIANYAFIPINARPMLTINASPPPGENPTDAAINAINQHNATNLERSIVRLRIQMTPEQEPAFREPAIRHALSNAHYIASIERRVQRDRRTRLPPEDAERLEPLDALQRYLHAKSVSPERQQTLLNYAERLLREETNP